MEGTLETLTIPAHHAHTATVIFIHGLGQSNLTWRMVVIEALAPKLPNVEWILPQAYAVSCITTNGTTLDHPLIASRPSRPVSLSQGYCRPSWFDIARLPPGGNEYDEYAISESVSLIENIILAQVHDGMDSRRIILMGFSQGAALGLMVSLTTLHDLGGAVSLSGWIPPRARQMMHSGPSLPILWCHGTADTEIPMSYATDSVNFLRNTIGYPPSKLQLRAYNGLGHTINDNELDDIASWLQEIVG